MSKQSSPAPETVVEFEQPDLHPPGQLVEVLEIGYLNHRVETTWRPARVIRRGGERSWLVAHDDCECWAWDDEQGEMRPARLSTYLRYPVTRLVPRVHRAARHAWWTAGRIAYRTSQALRPARAWVPDLVLLPGTTVVLQPVDDHGRPHGRAYLLPVLDVDAHTVTFPTMLGCLTRRPDGRLYRAASGEVFTLTSVVSREELEYALALHVDLDSDTDSDSDTDPKGDSW